MRVDGDLFALPNASDHDPAGVVTWMRTPGMSLSAMNFSKYCFAASIVADEEPAVVGPVALGFGLLLLSELENAVAETSNTATASAFII
jgi:hypothetical protein